MSGKKVAYPVITNVMFSNRVVTTLQSLNEDTRAV
jgi:hypothetical protein